MYEETVENVSISLEQLLASPWIALFLAMFFIIVALSILIINMKQESKEKKTKGPKIQTEGKLTRKERKELRCTSMQKTLPWKEIYANGVIELKDGTFSKAYVLKDVNFVIASDEEQTEILNVWASILNLLPLNISIQTVIYNRKIEKEQLKEKILLKPHDDNLQAYRDEFNEKVLLRKIDEGSSNIIRERYLIINCKADNVKKAHAEILNAQAKFETSIAKISDDGIKGVNRKELLSIIYSILNQGTSLEFGQKKTLGNKVIQAYDLEWARKAGLTTKDLVSPLGGIKFSINDFLIGGDTYGATIFIKNLSDQIVPEINKSISALPYSLLQSTRYDPEALNISIKKARNKLTNVRASVINAQKRAGKEGYSTDLINPELEMMRDRTQDVLKALTAENQKILYVTHLTTVFAKSKEELRDIIKDVIDVGQEYLADMENLTWMEEPAFLSSLPLGYNKISLDTLQTTSSATAFHPYNCIDILEESGIWYGQNDKTQNYIMLDRKKGNNYNAVTIGFTGSGKSMQVKNEITQLLWKNPHDCIYIIDPQGEYTKMAAALGGSVVHIAPGTKTFLNPLDFNINDVNDAGDDPIATKVSYLEGLISSMMEGLPVTPDIRSTINRCGRAMYVEYVKHLNNRRNAGEDIEIDYEAMPTVQTLFEMLQEDGSEQGAYIADAIEMFVYGTKDLFAHHTNVSVDDKRLVVFDIKDLPTDMKRIGIQVCQNFIWNKGITNHIMSSRIGRGEKNVIKSSFINKDTTTWIYMDEFHIIGKDPYLASNVDTQWKLARKWDIGMNAITNRLGDLLFNDAAKSILGNSQMVTLMKIRKEDRVQAQELFELSDSAMEYLASCGQGHGILCWGEQTFIEFDATYPTDSSIFPLISTNKNELLSL